ncbi:hypothetical protein MPC4_110117 [Methylocella tundrae]|uniref:Uncharacterized protein n=1 Tax=Methylocella tundrae TaxID=227605 RepID=A0A8B6M1A8_METTU|nr:hypothetical protein MPC4_110117 [Methylocella tundrae]
MLCLRGKPTDSLYPTTSARRFQQAGDSESGLFPQDGVDYALVRAAARLKLHHSTRGAPT